MELTKSEMEIMDVLWCDGGALSRADFLARSEQKSWKDSSVHILLNGLLSKGMICEAGFVRHNKTYGRTFLPTMTREEYFAATIFSHRYKPDMLGLMKALLDRPEVTAETLQALEAQIKAKKETR
ncbi:MAG: BlaI/MecI/CopY family transcriptional regulator [Oscillospiraceae bacterium]|nr:BlaI/MecI/CopY family transcriptional regulator [Oscillospiraceae bacterium]